MSPFMQVRLPGYTCLIAVALAGCESRSPNNPVPKGLDQPDNPALKGVDQPHKPKPNGVGKPKASRKGADASIVLYQAEEESPDSFPPNSKEFLRARNGAAYDLAKLSLAKGQVLVLPKTAHVVRDGEEGQPLLYVRRRLAFAGIGDAIHPRDLRKFTGCVTRTEGGKLVLATYGAWDSGKEGGWDIFLVVRASKATRIETRAGLSERRIGGGAIGDPDPGQPAPGRDGWKKVPTVPDPKRTAEKLAPPEAKE